MGEEILKSIPVFISSMLKFILGPLTGYAAGLHILTTIIATTAGMMCSVIAFTYFGDWIRSRMKGWFSTSKSFTEKNPRLIGIWKKFGLPGIAALTPLILTPIGGTILAVGFGSPKEKIIIYMLVSAVAWAIIFTVIVYFFGHHMLPDFIK
jgi:hypothetical protein